MLYDVRSERSALETLERMTGIFREEWGRGELPENDGEIFFRGFAKNFCAGVLGETTAFLLFNMMFGLLDWFNMGHSFVVGLLWIWGYKKSKHLIVPMLAHGGMNLISVVFYIITL